MNFAKLLLLPVALITPAGFAADGIRLHGDSSVVFASIEQGKAALQKSDRYTKALSRFDLESRLATNAKVSTDDLLNFAAKQVVAWNEADREKVTAIVKGVRERLAELELPLPETVLLVQTTGKEEGNAAYCRGPAIILPTRYVGFRAQQLERILIHELFHVLSNQNEDLRRSLYEIIGFTPCPEVALPDSLANRKITNPDGPSLRYCIELESDGEKLQAVPLLFAKSRYDAAKGGSFFAYLQFKLLVVEEAGDRLAVAMKDGEPLLLDPKNTPSFHDQIGKNTSYNFHPDEILAENFVHLVMQSKELPTPKIIEQMRAKLGTK